MDKRTVKIHINPDELNDAIEKANRLVALLKEARLIVDSLSGKSVQSGIYCGDVPAARSALSTSDVRQGVISVGPVT